jgi:single-strand DNA-binding protein
MFDTYVTVIGNVLHEPEQRQTSNTGAVVTTFKIASTARRLDRQSGKWIDGNSVRVRVTCWRALAANVKQSVHVGDPLVVYGRLFTRDWEDEQGNKRLAYELEAVAVGHDLSRGRAVFERAKPRTSTSAIEDEQSDVRVGGEPTEPVADDRAVQFDDTPFEAVFDQPAAAPLDDSFPVAGTGPVDRVGEEPDGLADGGPVTPVGGDPDDEPTPIGEPGTGRRRGLRRPKVPA